MSKYSTPLEMLYKWEKQNPNKVYLQQPLNGEWRTFTWKQVGEEVRKMAAAIKAMNLPANSHIGLVSKNCAHWIMADLAIMMSGHVSVPLYPNINAETINYVLTHSETKLLFVGKLDDWNGMKSGVPSDVQCISFPTYYGDTGYEQWDDIVAQHEPMQGEPNRDLDELITIIYTSGTTGKPKGVVHTYRALTYAITHALEVVSVSESGTDGRFFSYLPLSHIAERLLVEMGGLYTNSTVYFAESLDVFAQNLATASPTVFLAVPRIWTKFQMKILEKMPQSRLNILLKIPILNNIIRKKIRTTLGLNDARHVFTGAAPTPASLMEWFGQFDLKIQEVYGMTENCAYSHYTRRENIKYGYVGQPMPRVDVKISEIGEILVKSEATMKEYYKEPEKTAETFDGDYLRTGDKGVISQGGFLKITGRVKDIFKTEKGKYVSPSPIELKLSKNTDIEQVCVVGTLLPQTMALVVLSEGARKKDRNEIASSLEASMKEVNPTLEKHERMKKCVVMKDDWTVENAMLTPTMKIKQNVIEEKHQDNYTTWYAQDGSVVWE